jgi:hypothetical protein
MNMHRRTLSLLATPAVVGAMIVAVPALAGRGTQPTGQESRARRCNAVTVINHGRQVRACLLRGPRGPRGFTGLTGLRGLTGGHGATGPQGPKGVQGVAGPAGTARAYAVVQPTVVQPTAPTAATLIPGQTSHITSVSEPSAGIYCLTPAAGIYPAADTAAVSPEVGYSSSGKPGVIALNAKGTDCPSGNFEVETYAPGTELKLASGYAFTIVVP